MKRKKVIDVLCVMLQRTTDNLYSCGWRLAPDCICDSEDRGGDLTPEAEATLGWIRNNVAALVDDAVHNPEFTYEGAARAAAATIDYAASLEGRVAELELELTRVKAELAARNSALSGNTLDMSMRCKLSDLTFANSQLQVLIMGIQDGLGSVLKSEWAGAITRRLVTRILNDIKFSVYVVK